MKPLSVYIHIPFCAKKCPYCDFNTYALKRVPEQEYVNALSVELELRLEQFPLDEYCLHSLYFGGGTPSLLSPQSIESLINAVAIRFEVHREVEVTLEANPTDLSRVRSSEFRSVGVNRLSLGSQSFQGDVLQTLGRRHRAKDIHAAVASAQGAGFSNISLDLIYGVPGQSLDLLAKDLAEIRALGLPHLSTYGLTIEKGTPFFQAVKDKVMILPEEDQVLEMMVLIREEASLMGMERYEISNYAVPGFEAKHNLAYWNHQAYLGLGAGAHSFQWTGWNTGRRWSNIGSPEQYIACAEKTKGSFKAWSEDLDMRDLLFEEFFLGLRKAKGVNLSSIQFQYGVDLKRVFSITLPLLFEQELIKEENGYLSLTEKGLPLADSVIENFSEVDRVSWNIVGL